MFWRLLNYAAIAFLLCLYPQTASAQAKQDFAATADVTRTAAGWLVDYRLNSRARVWLFPRSALDRARKAPWRPASWTVLTPGVRIERKGRYDALVADDGEPLPSRIKIRVTPFSHDLLADYDPTMTLTNGTQALFTGHFEIVAMQEGVDLGGTSTLDGSNVAASGTRLTFHDPGAEVRMHGLRQKRAVVESGEPTYVIFGKVDAVDDPDSVAILDPKLPDWISREIRSEIPQLFNFYAEKLGQRSGDKPTVLVSWAGPTPQLRSMGGSVITDIIVARLEGEGVSTESDTIRRLVRKFLALEGSHFWVGQTVRYESRRDAWLTEGAAELLSIRAIGSVDPAFDQRAEVNMLLAECLILLPKGPLTDASDRGDLRANYACGAMLGLVAEAAAKRAGGDFFTFWRTLIEANRTDRTVTMNEWLIHLSEVSGDRSLTHDVRKLLIEKTERPAAALRSLFDKVGIAYQSNDQGQLTLI